MMFKPRGPQKPSFKNTGISHFTLIKFFEEYRNYVAKKDPESESAFTLELLEEYFKNDYDPDKTLKFDPVKLGL